MTIKEVAKKNKVTLSRDRKPKSLEDLLEELKGKLEILKTQQLDRLEDKKIFQVKKYGNI